MNSYHSNQEKNYDAISNRYTYPCARSHICIICRVNIIFFSKKREKNRKKRVETWMKLLSVHVKHFNHVSQSVSWTEGKKRLSDLYGSERLVARTLVLTLVLFFFFAIFKPNYYFLFALMPLFSFSKSLVYS